MLLNVSTQRNKTRQHKKLSSRETFVFINNSVSLSCSQPPFRLFCSNIFFLLSDSRNSFHFYAFPLFLFLKACSQCFRHVHFNIFSSLLRKLRIKLATESSHCRVSWLRNILPDARWKINFVIVRFNNSYPSTYEAKSNGLRNPLKSFFDHWHPAESAKIRHTSAYIIHRFNLLEQIDFALINLEAFN